MDSQNATKLSPAERVKRHRQLRKELGLRELKFWVCEEDAPKIQQLLRPFLKKSDNLLHEAKGGKFPRHKLKAVEQQLFEK